MTEWGLFLSKVLAGGLRFLIGLFLINRLLKGNKPDKKGILVGVAGAVVISFAVAFLFLSDFFQMGLEAAWISFCAARTQKTDRRMGLFVAVFYEIAVAFWRFLFSAGLGLVFRSESYMDSHSLYGQIPAWMLLLLLSALAVYFFRKPDRGGKDGFRMITVVTLSGFIAVVTLSEQTILSIPDDTLTMWTILAVVLMMSILVFHMKRQYEVEKEMARLKADQAELLERNYTTLNQAYEVNAKLFHDFHNHIGALRQMLSHGNYESAMAYLDELQEPVREMTDTVWTGDETIDYLINSKMSAAAGEQVRMNVQVEFPRNTNIRSADMCAIVGNLLDNALEAVRKVPDAEQRFVSLTIRRINQMLVIKVENCFADELKSDGGILKTTKTEGGLHGWGLKSARAAAEKYDGTIQTTDTGTVFRAVATLSYRGISEK